MEKISTNGIMLWLEELFEAPENTISAESIRDNIEGWDSLGTLTLMAELDQRFEIALTEETLEDFTSVAAVIDLIQKKGLLSQ